MTKKNHSFKRETFRPTFASKSINKYSLKKNIQANKKVFIIYIEKQLTNTHTHTEKKGNKSSYLQFNNTKY